MKRIIYTTLAIIVLLAGIAFAIQNRQVVELNYYFGLKWSGPLSLALLTSLAIGVVAGYLASLRMNQAKSWAEFVEACTFNRMPSENMVWVDKTGTIGWVGGQCFPATAANLHGVEQGAAYADAEIKVLSTFTGRHACRSSHSRCWFATTRSRCGWFRTTRTTRLRLSPTTDHGKGWLINIRIRKFQIIIRRWFHTTVQPVSFPNP